MYRVDRYMQKAVIENIFPGAVLLVVYRDKVEFFEAYGWANLFTRERMTVRTVFDLASLTKPLATTLTVVKLINDSQLHLGHSLGNLLPLPINSDKSTITIEMLLRHTSGCPAHRTYYKMLQNVSHLERKNKIRLLLYNEPLVNEVGKITLYSDLGFMLLAEVVEHVTQEKLDQWVVDHIYTPLGLTELFFVRHFENQRLKHFAATELCPFRHMLLSGIVHDDNAYAIGGVCGHAGLFGTAENIKQLLMVLLECYKGTSDTAIFAPEVIRKFFKRPSKNERPLGFDAPASNQSSSGTLFSQQSVGHLGFTGTSFWMDLENEIIVILLTNRVHPHRNNNAIRQFRPRIHDVIMLTLGAK